MNLALRSLKLPYLVPLEYMVATTMSGLSFYDDPLMLDTVAGLTMLQMMSLGVSHQQCEYPRFFATIMHSLNARGTSQDRTCTRWVPLVEQKKLAPMHVGKAVVEPGVGLAAVVGV